MSEKEIKKKILNDLLDKFNKIESTHDHDSYIRANPSLIIKKEIDELEELSEKEILKNVKKYIVIENKETKERFFSPPPVIFDEHVVIATFDTIKECQMFLFGEVYTTRED